MAGSYEQVVGWAYRLLQLSTSIAPVSKGINPLALYVGAILGGYLGIDY